jgi:hypothetical protein
MRRIVKVSKKCPSRILRAVRDVAIYEGAGSRIRTDDLLITNQLLYQLSYAGGKRTAQVNLQSRREQVVGFTRGRANTRRAVPPSPNS